MEHVGMNRVLSRIAFGSAAALLLAACAADDTPLGPETARNAAVPARPALASDRATVYVVHGINGADLGAPAALPVDISVDGACVLTGFEFRQIAGPLELPATTYDIQVRIASASAPCTGALAIDAAGVQLAPGANVSIVAHLTEGGTPTASVCDNDLTLRPGRSGVIARHAAAFGRVDVLVDGRVAFTGVSNGAQGAAVLRPGRHTLAIAPAGTRDIVWQSARPLLPAMIYAAYAVGSPGNGTFEVLLQAIPAN